MPQYIIAYKGMPKSLGPEKDQANQQKWMGWMQGHGAAMVVPGQPLGPSWTVTEDGATEGHDNPMTGYSIVEAADMDAALGIAQGCPYVEVGTLEVAELRTMGPKG